MCIRDRVTASQSYSEALNIVSEYVETELTPSPTPKRDRGDAKMCIRDSHQAVEPAEPHLQPHGGGRSLRTRGFSVGKC